MERGRTWHCRRAVQAAALRWWRGGVDRKGGAGGGHGCPGLVVGGPRGKGRVESRSKSPKKHLLRDYSSFSPYQIFSPKKSPMFGFLVPKVPGTYEKVPITKQGRSPPTKKSVAAESIQSSSEGKALAEPRRESRERRPNTRMARLTMGLWHV